MIQLYCTDKESANATTFIIIGRPCQIKKLFFFGTSKAVFLDAATLVDASTEYAKVLARTATPVATLRGTVSAPVDRLECNENEIISCVNGLAVITSAPEAAASVRAYTMGNPVGTQGSL